MDRSSILLPVIALATLTFAVLLLIPIRRFRAGFRGQVTSADFKFGESERVPDEVKLANRNYMNLLEIPVLFYTVCILFFVTETVDPLAVQLAWAYVALRAVHCAIHVTYNKVRHRLYAFALSNVALIVMWTHFYRGLIA